MTNTDRSMTWDSVWSRLGKAVGMPRLFGAAPPPGAESGLGAALWTDPRPLIFPRDRIIVVFSPKSACTSVLIWFYHQIGHAQAARDYSSWPHNYRTDVYYGSRAYRRSFERNLSRHKLVRIIRDPFERAVSSFRHVQKGGLAEKEIAKVTGRSDMSTAGLSFSEFLDFLERCDLATCDTHFRVQRHPIEDYLPTSHVINASRENLFERLNQVEADYNLTVTDFANVPWLRKINPAHTHVVTQSFGDDVYTRRFNREDARSGAWPSYDAFLVPAARERLARLYATDIDAYGLKSAERRPPRSNPPLFAVKG